MMTANPYLLGRTRALILAATLFGAGIGNAAITVDGSKDADYGTPLAVQSVTSSWGPGNTLASLSVRQEGSKLYVFVAGRANGNSLSLFVDSKSGGANKLVSGLVSGGGEEWRIHNFSVGGNSTTDGLTFENGFTADYAINVQSGGWTSLFPLNPSSPQPRTYIGNMINDASISGGPVSKGKQSTSVDVSNVATHANGWEFEFDITSLGVGNGEAEQVKFLALIITDGVNLSPNQVLGSLPNSTDLGGWGSFQATNFESISGVQTVTATVNNADADGDGTPNSSDTDDDNDGLLDTVETNTGTFVDAADTGTNPLVPDTDADGFNDGAEVNGTSALGKATNPLKKNYASMLVAGNFLTPQWSGVATSQNTMSAVTGDEFGWEINYLFSASTPIELKFLAGSWSTDWGTSGTLGTAAQGGGNISLVPGSGVFRIYFNTDTLAYTFTRATFPTYTEFATAYGVTGTSTDDDDFDGLTNQQEFENNTHPGVADTDGDGLSDASEVDGSAATGNLGVAVATNPLLADTDGDGLRDDWEISYFLDPTDDGSVVSYTNYIPADIGLTITANPNGGSSDPDADTLTNIQEFSAGSSPLAAGSGFVANNAVITIPGAFNGWDAVGTPANTMALVGNFSWKALLYFAAVPTESRFKFANGTAFGSGPSHKNWGVQLPDNGTLILNGGDIVGSSAFTAPGYYAVTFNDFTLAYTLAPVASADVDADGLPDEYEAFYGNQLPSPATNLDPTEDYNGDGKTTAQNYADGTNPVKDVAAPSVALAPGVDKVTWYALGATIPAPSAADVVANDDVTTTPAITILSPDPDNSVNGFNTVIYQATDAAGNYTLFRRVIAVGSATPAYYNLRYPATMTVNTASSNSAYGQIFIANATAGAGQATGVNAWVGVNSNNTDPSTWDASAWTAASYIGEEGNDDNYQGAISGAGRAPGTYYYATRFQIGTNNANTNFFFGGITTNGVGNAWGSVTNTNNEVTTYGNGVLTVQASRLVTFTVDMNVQTNKVLFDPATQGVEVRGSFNDWAGGAATLNNAGTGVYSGTFVVAGNEGGNIEYKFYRTGTNNAGYEGIANNRLLALGADGAAQAPDSVYFNNDDGIGPVIGLSGDNPLNLNVGDTYTDPGASATDLVDGSVAATPSGSVNTSVAGTYYVTYNASDNAGNSGTPVVRTVIVTNSNPYDSWASQSGLTGADALPTADPDKDGYTNRQEYAFGGNPNANTAGLVKTSVSGGNLTVMWLERGDLSYDAQSTANLATTAFASDASLNIAESADQTGLPVGYTRKQFTVPATGRAFFRVSAVDQIGSN